MRTHPTSFLLFHSIASANTTSSLIESQYSLGAGDLILITVFGQEDLTVETRLSNVGTIRYPFLGDIKLIGRSVSQVEELIDENKLDKIQTMHDELQADGLIIHVNPLQEWAQHEGDRFKRAPIETIKFILNSLTVAVLVLFFVGARSYAVNSNKLDYLPAKKGKNMKLKPERMKKHSSMSGMMLTVHYSGVKVYKKNSLLKNRCIHFYLNFLQ